MIGKTTVLIALLVAGASLAGADTPRAPKPGDAPRSAPPTMKQPQITGTITWTGAPAAKAGDNCANFKVSGFQSVPGTTPAGGVNAGPGGTDLGITGHASGNVRQNRCSYMIGGLPTGREVFVSVRYAGPMGEGGPSATSRFTLQDGQKASQNVQVSFVHPR
jgi:hypothetical protein